MLRWYWYKGFRALKSAFLNCTIADSAGAGHRRVGWARFRLTGSCRLACRTPTWSKELSGSSLRFATLAQRHGSLWAMFPSIERRVANEETLPECSGPRRPKSAAVG